MIPGLSLHQKGSADIQRMFILLTFGSSATDHVVTETLGDTSSLNIIELVLCLDWPQYLTLQTGWQDQLTPKDFSQSQVSPLLHLTSLAG